jgi:hypothetical protein
MLTILDEGTALCNRVNRREWIRAGSLGAGGLSLAHLLAARNHANGASVKQHSGTSNGPAAAFGKAKSVILFWLTGGAPQHETWDTKPDAPPEIRGSFGSIASKTPGLFVGELMPKTALLTDKIAVLRAVVTGDNAHSSSGYQMLTGVPHIPVNAESVTAKAPNLWPCADSIVRTLRPSRNGLPPSVVLPEHIWNDGNFPWPGQDGGFLGRKYDPWLIHCDPNTPTFRVPDLSFPDEISSVRFDARRSLLEQVNRHLDETLQGGGVQRFGDDVQQAIGLLSGAAGRRAFDLSQEPDSVRDRYGRSRYAQSVLLSRRLVESGVSIVRINWTRIKDQPNQGGWDTHATHAKALESFLMPIMDQCYSALLEDLSERGLLDETLVVWLGEFGHTPKINGNAGRDHWGNCFSIAMAGGGIRGGTVYGASDKDAAFPIEGRVTPADMLATIYHCLGNSPDTEIHDTEGRPFPISRGNVIEAIL